MRKRSRSGITSSIILPITPMLDMTFQLLFFLLLTMKPSTVKEGEFKLRAIEPGQKPGSTSLDEPADEPRQTLMIVLRALPDDSGAIGGLTLHAVEGEWTFADTAELQRHLAKRRQEDGAGKVCLKPDSRLRLAGVMAVFDLCWQTGFREIGFAN